MRRFIVFFRIILLELPILELAWVKTGYQTACDDVIQERIEYYRKINKSNS